MTMTPAAPHSASTASAGAATATASATKANDVGRAQSYDVVAMRDDLREMVA